MLCQLCHHARHNPKAPEAVARFLKALEPVRVDDGDDDGDHDGDVTGDSAAAATSASAGGKDDTGPSDDVGADHKCHADDASALAHKRQRMCHPWREWWRDVSRVVLAAMEQWGDSALLV